ncbi:oligosaccharide flippase family protein [Alteromonas macleodii]|uniref:oligosaccharide flippase family protein n=1 Tax=Alteromonas macleodii TaxID=28108 RepID=UPI0030D41E1E
MSKITKSLIHTFTGRYAFVIINLISMMTYARMLTPEEIGVHVIAIAASSIIIELRLIGTGSYLIKLKEVKKEDTENVLFVTLCISLFLGFILLSVSDWLSDFYSTPGMSAVIDILFATFLLSPFTAVSQSFFARTFNFKTLASINVLSALFSFITTVFLIQIGLSYLSLAIGVLASHTFQFFAHFFLKSEMVSWVPKPGNFKSILSFGGILTIITFINKGLESIPELVLGKSLGTDASALFSRGLGAVKFSNETVLGFVSPIITPYFSEAKRNGEYATQAFEKASSHVTVLIIPILLSLAVVPDLTISLLFGPQWLEASELMSILCSAFAIKAPTQFLKNLLIVEGKELYILLVKLFSFLIFIILALTLGVESLLKMAYAFAFAQIVEMAAFYFAVARCINFNFKAHFTKQLKSYYIALICMLVTFGLSRVSESLQLSLIAEAFILAIVLSVTWLALIKVLKHEVADTIYQLIRGVPLLKRLKLERFFLN